jgi:hypothetical protein
MCVGLFLLFVCFPFSVYKVILISYNEKKQDIIKLNYRGEATNKNDNHRVRKAAAQQS